MKMFNCLLLIAAILAGCMAKSPKSETPAPGFPAGSVTEMKLQISRACWYCGDYTGPVTGNSTLPSPSRICGEHNNPRWSGSCPTITTLGDGSTWQFQGGCRCDG